MVDAIPDHQFPARHPDLGVGETGDQIGQAGGMKLLAHIGKEQDFARCFSSAVFKAAAFPLLGSARNSIFVRPLNLRTMFSVVSVEPSDTTRISTSSAG